MADFKQRTSTTLLGQSVRDGCDWPIQGQEGKDALFFRRPQRAVETQKLRHQVVTHAQKMEVGKFRGIRACRDAGVPSHRVERCGTK